MLISTSRYNDHCMFQVKKIVFLNTIKQNIKYCQTNENKTDESQPTSVRLIRRAFGFKLNIPTL